MLVFYYIPLRRQIIFSLSEQKHRLFNKISIWISQLELVTPVPHSFVSLTSWPTASQCGKKAHSLFLNTAGGIWVCWCQISDTLHAPMKKLSLLFSTDGRFKLCIYQCTLYWPITQTWLWLKKDPVWIYSCPHQLTAQLTPIFTTICCNGTCHLAPACLEKSCELILLLTVYDVSDLINVHNIHIRVPSCHCYVFDFFIFIVSQGQVSQSDESKSIPRA